MPEFTWNEVDFLDYFEVEPCVQDEVVYSYEIQRNGLRLLFTVWPHESVIQATLFRTGVGSELFSFAAYVRGQARYVNDKRGRYIEISDCVIAPDRFWYIQAGDLFDRIRFPVSLTIEVEVNPDIRIAFVTYESQT